MLCSLILTCITFFFSQIQEVTGIYTNNFDLSLNTKNGFPVFATVIEANYVTKKQDLFSAYKLTQEDKEEIEKLAKDPRIGERVGFRTYNHTLVMLDMKRNFTLNTLNCYQDNKLSCHEIFSHFFIANISDY